MKFRVEHLYEGVTFPEYEQIHFDEGFNTELSESVKLGRTLLKLDRTAERIVRHVKIEPAREIPGPVAKLLGGNKFSYVEELEYEIGKGRGRWRTITSVLTDKIDSQGTLELVSAPGGVKRVVAGEIKVGIFGVGGIVEKFVVSDVEKSYDAAAAFTREYLKKRG
jgi:hypothetical protein